MHNTFQTTINLLVRKMVLALLVLFSLLMAYTGLVALHEGTTRFMEPFRDDQFAQITQQKVEALRQAPTQTSLAEVSQELGNLARATSVQHVVESRLLDQGIYYASMPQTNQILLVSHVLLGVFCLLVGGFQFLPAFRKQYMKIHRTFGALYIVTALLSVALSLIYLALTPPHHIYAHLVAWVALWVFGLLAIFAIGMAVRAIRAKRIHEHQSWMALSFGCLIVAPMLRWNWMLLGLVFPDIDQETLNLVTMTFMLPEVLLISYSLILINRQYQRALVRRKTATVAIRMRNLFLASMPLWWTLAGLAIAINAATWVFADGTLSLAPTGVIPGSLPDRELTTFQRIPWLGLLLTMSNGAALLTTLGLLKRLLDNRAETAHKSLSLSVAVINLIMAALALYAGSRIGLAPDLQLFSGGTLFMVAGTLLGIFSLFFLGSYLADRSALMKESLVFLLATLPFNALLLAFLWVIHWLRLPSDYLTAGQGYVLPAGASTALFFVAIFYVVYGQATREHG